MKNIKASLSRMLGAADNPEAVEAEMNENDVIFVGQGGYNSEPYSDVAWYLDETEMVGAKQLYKEILPAIPNYIITGAILMTTSSINKYVEESRSLLACLHTEEDIKSFLTFMAMISVDIKPYKKAKADGKHASFYTREENPAIKQFFSKDGSKRYMQDPPYVLGWYSPKENDKNEFPYSHDHITVDMTVLNLYINSPSDA